MRAMRLWSVRNSRGLMKLYEMFEGTIMVIEPLARKIGYQKLERPVVAVERNIKGLMFDCQMCGQCALSSTGMSCPMNCPKNLRNGPCGGVRSNGHCEVKPEMPCVWVEAWEGSQAMANGKFFDVQEPVDHRMKGSSSWLRIMRQKKDGTYPEPKESARTDIGKIAT
ncbi:MAG: methylenetetrahydrofolate reductase C-terminal domain-containing protein [Rhodospirillales bacterium]|nr:methylenetetrahydrofolate reductase C-terminal domain-containing protein [Rhodospirillales bacterium]